MKVSIVIATCHRPRMLYDMLDSLYASTNWIRSEIALETVLVIDEDEESFDVARNFETYDGKIIDYSGERRGALVAWNRGLQICTGDIIVPAGDDQVFHGNWLDYALESHRERLGGSGVVGMNDLAYNGNTQVATMFLFDRGYCKDYMGGVLCPPVYKYYCIDSEWNEVAKKYGKFYWDERSKVEHLHSAHGKRPYDQLDKEKEDAGWMAEDNKTFQERKARGFPIEWSSLI